MGLTEAALLREVARVQQDKTIQAMRDAIDAIPISKSTTGGIYRDADRTAREFRADVVAALIEMREADRG